MLEKPDIRDETILAAVRQAYRLSLARIDFLPLGADSHTAVYQARTVNGETYFVKLRSGVFDDLSVRLPKFLHDQGVEHLIVPQETLTGALWADMDAYKLVLYPFVQGHNGYQAPLSGVHWRQLGRAFRRIHSLQAPANLTKDIQRERFSPQWREMLREIMESISESLDSDPLVTELTAFLERKRGETVDLIARAESLADDLAYRELDFVLCHTDIHAGNVLVDSSGDLYIVDWDDPILAPKERDLMFVGGGLWGDWYTPQQEEVLFYQGYGHAPIDRAALAYYRYERIVVDIALFSQSILEARESLEDREQGLRYLKSNFQPNGTIQLARDSDTRLPET